MIGELWGNATTNISTRITLKRLNQCLAGYLIKASPVICHADLNQSSVTVTMR